MAFRALRVLVALLAPLATACGGVATIGAILAKPLAAVLPEDQPQFEDAARAFNDDMRWGRIRQAAAQVESDDRVAFLQFFEDDPTPYQFTSVEIVSAEPVKFSPDGKIPLQFDVLTAYEYYRPPIVTERRLRQKQTWRYLEDERRWQVALDLQVFRNEPVPAAPAR